MKKIRNGTMKGLCQFCKRLKNLHLLLAVLLLFPGGMYAQSKTERAGKVEEAAGILSDAPNATPMYMQSAAAIGDALDISTKPRNFSAPPRIEGIEGADVQRNYAVTHAYIKGDSGKPVMKSVKYSTIAAFGQYIIADSVSHASKTGEAGMYGFYRLPPMAPYVYATQGDYPDRVEITWAFDPLSPPANIDFFELKRDGEVIASLPVTESLYKDFNAQPGRYYQYELTGKNKYGVSAAGSEVGFVNPNGTITGRIMTKNGAPVKDVEVLMTPNLGKSLYMNGTNNYVSVGNKMDFRDTSFTFEFWLKHNAGDGGVFSCGQVNNDVSIDMVQGKMWFDMGTAVTNINHSPDGQWHHYAFVWDNVAKKAFIYKDSALVNTTQAPANHRINISGLPAYLGKTLYSSALFNGNIDELRLWRGARDQGSILRNMYRSVSTKTPNLEAYWRMDEGKGNKIFDFASKKHSGTVSGPIVFQDERAPIRNTTFTDNTGYYIAEGINYGTSTNFTVYPSRPGRIFIPENRLVTLSTSNTAVNNLDFTDISQIPVSGKISNSANPTCLNDTTIEILVDDSSWTPRTYANSAGEYIIEFEPGSQHKIKPSRPGYVFTPGFFQVDSIRAPLAQKNFAQMKTYNLTVKVAGGQCELALGGTSRVKITPVPACGTFSLTQDITSGTTTTFTGLGPSIFKIEVTRPSGDIVFEADTVDLRDTSRIKKMIYYAPLQVVVSNVTPAVPTTCAPGNVPILEQLKKYKLTYKAVEIYNGVECVIKGSKFYVTNEIADADGVDSLFAPTGTAADSFYAGLPNILAGGARPYQKQILLRAVDSLGRESQPSSFWALVTGVKPRAGNTFATTSPQLPLAVLRQPPGDMSFSYLSQATTIANEISVGSSSSDGTVKNSMFSILPTVEIGLGKGFVTTTVVTAPILQNYSNVTISHSNTKTSQLRTTMHINETVSTQNIGQTSGFKGDVIFGASYNIVYGITDSVMWDAAACTVKTAAGVSIAPDSIRTKFYYTEDYIRKTHIPNLYFLHTRRDSLHAKNWENFLKYNDSLKLKTVDSLYNISFSAGAVYSYSKSFTRDSILTFHDTFDTLKSNGTIGGLLVNNAGFTLDNGTVKYRIGMKDSIASFSTTNTTGFTLADDDNGDGFTVNVAQDKVFGSPVFRTVAGQSSCPYEPGTFERDKAVFTVKNVAATNVHPDSTAYWPIRLGNASSTDETRDYTLRVLNATNPNGLVIAVNGIIIQNGIQFTIPKGTIQTMLMVKRSVNIYSYSNIKLVLSPSCATPDQAASQSDTLTITALNYLRPCSPITITAPLDNWLVNSLSDNRLGVTIAGYDTNNTDFTQVKLQYRRPLNPDRPFGGFARYPIASLDGDDMMPRFDLTGYPVEQFPKRADLNTLYANTLDSYDASQEDRSGLVTGPMYENTYRNIVLKGYAAQQSQKKTDAASLANKQQKTSAADGDEGNSTIMPDNPENLWLSFKTLPKDSLSRATTPGYYNAVWLNSGLDEGAYQIRAVTVCNGSTIEATSAILNGLIDKTGPLVQGMPQPVSGILTLTDQIGITFNEDVLPSTAIKGNTVNLYYSSGPQSGQQLDFNFSCDGRTIIITPNIADRFIENYTLRAVVKKIKDVNGNTMRIPLGTAFIDSVSWEFVVQKSPVRWAGGDVTITKYLDETVQVTRELVNKSGFPNSFAIRKLPAWMSAAPLSGTVPGTSNVPVTFTIGTNVPFGVQQVTVTDSTIYGDQPLKITVNSLCRPPVWTVNTSAYQYTMNMVASLSISGTPSTDINDKIGVFVGNEVRGVAQLKKLNATTYRAFLTVYSNRQNNEALQFRVYDSSACTEYGQILESYSFAANTVLGTISAPVPITAANLTYQQYRLSNGWTWVSFNSTSPSMTVSSVLNSLNATQDDIIKDQRSFASYTGNGVWFGSLTTVDPKTMYLLRLAAKDSLARTGTPVIANATPIAISAGWNYIGYLPQGSMGVNEALASLTPASGDVVKSQFEFAIYDSQFGWVGDMQLMKPKLGYLLKKASAGTLTYPNSTGSALTPMLADDPVTRTVANMPEWTLSIPKYQHSMNIIAQIDRSVTDSLLPGSAIGIFSRGECVGIANVAFNQVTNKQAFFLTAYSNNLSGDTLTLRVYNSATNLSQLIQQKIVFEANSIQGSVREPVMLTSAPLGVRDRFGKPTEFALDQNYPNPFNPSTMISYQLPKAAQVTLKVFDILGNEVATLVNQEQDAGYYDVRFNAGKLVSGIYVYAIQAGDFKATKKLMLVK